MSTSKRYSVTIPNRDTFANPHGVGQQAWTQVGSISAFSSAVHAHPASQTGAGTICREPCRQHLPVLTRMTLTRMTLTRMALTRMALTRMALTRMALTQIQVIRINRARRAHPPAAQGRRRAAWRRSESRAHAARAHAG